MESVEIWKDIKNYDGIFQVSNMGRVRSIGRYCKHGDHVYFRHGKILTLCKRKSGYFKVTLQTDNHRKDLPIHRLVAEAFIPNPNNLNTVNHKDGNKANNTVENLEWLSYSDNTKHAHQTDLNRNHKHVKCVELGIVFDSLRDVAKYFNCSRDTVEDHIAHKRQSRILGDYRFIILE